MNAYSQAEHGPGHSSPTSPERQVGPDENVSPIQKSNRPHLAVALLALVMFAASLLYVAAIRLESFGFYHDDGIYVVMAKALAESQGYRIMSLPYEPVQTKSPPFYPLLLSLIWRAYPDFPANVLPMMLLSTAAAAMFLWLTWGYLVKQGYTDRWQALIIIFFAAINWRTVILASGVYSEMVYAALSVAGLHLAEKHEKEERGWASGLALGVIIGLAFLSRTAGITLLMAVGFYFAIKRKWRTGLLPVGVGAAIVLAWMAWGYFSKINVDTLNAAYYESYYRTFTEVLATSKEGSSSAFVIVSGLIIKNAIMIVCITVPLICLGLDYGWAQSVQGYLFTAGVMLYAITFIFVLKGFFRHISEGFRLLHIYVIAYIALHLLWPYAAYDRFLMPLLPFLLLFLITELAALVRMVRNEIRPDATSVKKLSAAFISLVLFAQLVAVLYISAAGINRTLAPGKNSIRGSGDEEAIRWINSSVGPSDVLVCYRDPLYYLHTGRKAARSSSMRASGLVDDRDTSVEDQERLIFRIINENNPRYLIITSSDFDQEGQPEEDREVFKKVIDLYPQTFVPVFESTDGRSAVYRIESKAAATNAEPR